MFTKILAWRHCHFFPTHPSGRITSGSYIRGTKIALLQKRGSAWLKSRVLYADPKVIVLNKPSGLVCQLNHSDYKLKSEREHMFLNRVFEDIRKISPSVDPYSIHRLDKMTTGCFVVPITHSSTKFLSTQLQQGSMKKTYLALVRGGEKSFTTTSGEITDEILYSDGRAEIHPVGKPSTTKWTLLSSSPKAPVSLLELDLITGNKHQLRIHLARILKTPILGDTLYSKKPLNESIASLTTIPKDSIFLHSAKVAFFQHRPTGRRYLLEVGAPPPKEFVKICDDLEIPIPSTYAEANLTTDGNEEYDGSSSLSLWDPTKFW